MTWCNSSDVSEEETSAVRTVARSAGDSAVRAANCPSCGHSIELQNQAGIIHDLLGLPAGVKFDPSDQEILEHLEAKVVVDARKIHPLIDEFIPTLEGENGICYTHPEKLPGVSKDGQLRHFFHRPSKAYTTGTRKRRKVHSGEDGSETRWHKTGKTRAVLVNGTVKGFKKILVLYTNYGRQRKPEKTNWVMHQYHLGNNEEEKDGEMVVSKVFYQTQPRQCGSALKDEVDGKLKGHQSVHDAYLSRATGLVEYNYSNSSNNNNNQGFISYDQHGPEISSQLLPNLMVHGDGSVPFIRFTTDSSKGKIS